MANAALLVSLNSRDDSEWRPIAVEDDHRSAILEEDPTITVTDTIEQQRRDLARLRPAPSADLLAEPTQWFYYRWRHAFVHLLGREAFTAVRADRNRNKITTQEHERLRRLHVGVVGLSVGHAVAHTLALEGSCGHIHLADFDEIELSNLNRIPATVFDLGVNKAVVVARRIAELDPYIGVSIDPRGLHPDTLDSFVAGLDVVIEECDSFDVKLAVREAARRHRLPLVMETSDRGLIDVERYDLEPDRPLFHGLLGDLRASDLAGLSTHDKVPYVLRVLEPGELSAAMAASMTEVDETVSTWPQLGGDISLGAATVAAAVRRLGLDRPLASGRVRVDVEEALSRIVAPSPPVDVSAPTPADSAAPTPPADPREAVVHAAHQAPSGGNTQPWRLSMTDDALHLELDPTQTSTLDLSYRASAVSIGAALFNARVAAARHGLLGAVEILGASGGGDGSASGEPAGAVLHLGSATDPELAALYEPMLQRVTNRRIFHPRPIPAGVLDTLTGAAEAEGGSLSVLTEPTQLTALAELLGESDRLRYLTPQLHADLLRELRWPNGELIDWGLDVRALELDASDLAKLGVARRRDVMDVLAAQDLGRALGDSTRDRVGTAPAVAIVTTDGSTAADYVRGGQAVERVWIEAHAAGLAVHPVSPVFLYAVEDADYEELAPRYADRLRDLSVAFRDLAGVGPRQTALVLRLGYAPMVTVRSRRRPFMRTVDLETKD